MPSRDAIAAVLGVACLSALPGVSEAQPKKCPAYSHKVSEDSATLVCKCNAPLIKFAGRCQLKVAVEEALQQRILAALKGVEATQVAIEADKSALAYSALSSTLKPVLIQIGAAYLKKDPTLLASAAMTISYDLGQALTTDTCDATPSLRAECANLRSFKAILYESADELQKVRAK